MDDEYSFEGRSVNFLVSKEEKLQVEKLSNDPDGYTCTITEVDNCITYHVTEDYDSVMRKINGNNSKTTKKDGQGGSNLLIDLLFDLFIKK